MELLSLELLRELCPLDLRSSDEELRSLITSRMKDLTRAKPFCFGDTVAGVVVLSSVLDLLVCSCLLVTRDLERLAFDSATAFLVFASASATTLWLGRGGTGGGPFNLVVFMGCALVCTISMLKRSVTRTIL